MPEKYPFLKEDYVRVQEIEKQKIEKDMMTTMFSSLKEHFSSIEWGGDPGMLEIVLGLERASKRNPGKSIMIEGPAGVSGLVIKEGDTESKVDSNIPLSPRLKR